MHELSLSRSCSCVSAEDWGWRSLSWGKVNAPCVCGWEAAASLTMHEKQQKLLRESAGGSLAEPRGRVWPERTWHQRRGQSLESMRTPLASRGSDRKEKKQLFVRGTFLFPAQFRTAQGWFRCRFESNGDSLRFSVGERA